MQLAYIRLSPIPSRSANSIHVMKMCQALQQEGYGTTLLLPAAHRAGCSDLDAVWHHYGIVTPFEIRYTAALPGLRGHDFYAWAAWWARRHAIELVYTRDLGAAAWASLLGISTVYEAHSLPLGRVVPIYLTMLFWGRGFRRLVVISNPLRALFMQHYANRLRAEHLLVAPDGVDLDRFQGLPAPAEARHRLGLPLNQFTVGYAGHLYAGRGIELILSLAQRLPEVRFLIMGGTDEAVAGFRDMTTTLACENLLFLGFIANASLPLYLAACDVLLMPYQRRVAVGGGGDTAAWMSPMKMFEYMAAVRLIISSDLPVLREVLNEGNSVLCQPDDLDAWQHAIEWGMANADLRETLAQRARQDVGQYAWRCRVRRILSGIARQDDATTGNRHSLSA